MRRSLALLLVLTACESPPSPLAVDVRSDLVPGVEVVAVRTALDDAATATLALTGDDDLLAGLRAASFPQVERGPHEIEVALLDDAGEVVVARRVVARVTQGLVVTVVLTRDCRGVMCPGAADDPTATQCLGGTCAPAECLDGSAACPAPECTRDADCADADACSAARCDPEGVCIYAPVVDACADTEYCDPELGCLPLPGSTPAFDPASNGCASADAGPFVELANATLPAGVFGLWYRAPYLLVAATGAGVRAYTFDGSTLDEVGSMTDVGWAEAIWQDGETYLVSAPGTGLTSFTLGPSGRVTAQRANTVEAVEARRGATEGTYLYVPMGGDGLQAFEWATGAIAPVGEALPTLSWASAAYVQGGTVFLADGGPVRALTFDGAAFTEVARSPTYPGASRAWAVDGVLHVAHDAGVSALTYDASAGTFTELAQAPTAGRAREVWSDGAHVFVAGSGGGIYAFAWTGSGYRLVDNFDTPGSALGVVSDGTYVYVGDEGGGVRVYGGFACTRFR